MANINFVTHRLATGGDCGWGDDLPRNIADLLAHGITDVIDMRQEYTDQTAFADLAPTINYHHIPMDDRGQTEGHATWHHVWEAATAALSAPAGKVLVHCHMGINRGPSAALAVMLCQGNDITSALSMIRAARPIAAMAYWADVLRWYHARFGTSARLATDLRAAAEWHDHHPLDVVRIIRTIRNEENDNAVAQHEAMTNLRPVAR